MSNLLEVRVVTREMRQGGTLYKYLTISLPKKLLAAANLRPVDKLAHGIEGNRVLITFDPENGNSSKAGTISINEKYLAHDLILGQDLIVPVCVRGASLVVDVPDECFNIHRGFNTLQTGFAQLGLDHE